MGINIKKKIDMSGVGEHAHAGHSALDEHLSNCADEHDAHAIGNEDYVHKHLAGCLPEGAVEEGGINVRAFKLWIAFVFFVICLAGLAPKAWGACSRNDTALSLLNCFSAGLFLAMALVHMMPEGAHLYVLWTKQAGYEEPEEAFPLPYAAFFAGYLLVLLVDRVIAKSCGQSHSQEEHEQAKDGKADEEAPDGDAARNRVSPKAATSIGDGPVEAGTPAAGTAEIEMSQVGADKTK